MKCALALVLALLGVQIAWSQTPSEITGITLGGGSSDSCPVLVTGIWSGSPADRAGIKSGDALIAVDDKPVKKLDDAVKLLHSEVEVPVTLRLMRGDSAYSKTIDHEKLVSLLEKPHLKLLSTGAIVSPDTTESEMKAKMSSLAVDRFSARVFPTHYPSDEKLYYAGFEVLILKNPTQVVVLGIEDSPASRAGVHWGDTILAVNGVDPKGKSIIELEKLFSSEMPATMVLKIERENVTKTYTFALEQVAAVLRDNKTQLYHGITLPVGVPDKYLKCFE